MYLSYKRTESLAIILFGMNFTFLLNFSEHSKYPQIVPQPLPHLTYKRIFSDYSLSNYIPLSRPSKRLQQSPRPLRHMTSKRIFNGGPLFKLHIFFYHSLSYPRQKRTPYTVVLIFLKYPSFIFVSLSANFQR